MKRIAITLITLVAMTSAASAQVAAFRQGSSAKLEGYALPRTVIAVQVTQEHEIIMSGPYARYAAELLGIMTAPISDRETYKISDVQISYFEEPDPQQVFSVHSKNGAPDRVFQWLTASAPQFTDTNTSQSGIDMVTPFKELSNTPISASVSGGTSKSIDKMAAEAAETIFRIRRRRMELITGEMGEGVYGEGMKAALDEMNRIEQEYLSLFVGKRLTRTIVKTVTIVPEAGQKRVAAFRFSDKKGIVSASDLSGRPIYMEFAAENIANKLTSPSRSKGTVIYRVPQMNEVSIIDDQQTLSTCRVPVYQAGGAVEAPII